MLDAALRVIRALPGDDLGALLDLLASERLAPGLDLFAGLLDYAATERAVRHAEHGAPRRADGAGAPLCVGAAFSTPWMPCSAPEVLALAEPLRATLALPEIRRPCSAPRAR